MRKTRFLEKSKTEQFRRRQRFYRLIGPILLLILLVAGDVWFLLTWAPYYHGGRPTRPVVTAAWFLFINLFVARLLLHFWCQVKWVFLWHTLRRLPIFALQAALFAVPFVPPMLALRGYRLHQTLSFEQRVPEGPHWQFVRRSAPAQRFEDSRYLYCTYARTRRTDKDTVTEIHFVRCRKGASKAIRKLKESFNKRLLVDLIIEHVDGAAEAADEAGANIKVLAPLLENAHADVRDEVRRIEREVCRQREEHVRQLLDTLLQDQVRRRVKHNKEQDKRDRSALILEHVTGAREAADKAEKEGQKVSEVLEALLRKAPEAARKKVREDMRNRFRPEFRIVGGKIAILYGLESVGDGVQYTLTADRGKNWSEWDRPRYKQFSPEKAYRPRSRHVHVPSSAEGLSLQLRRPRQILEDADHVHMVYFRNPKRHRKLPPELVYARFAKSAGSGVPPWLRPLAHSQKQAAELETLACNVLGQKPDRKYQHLRPFEPGPRKESEEISDDTDRKVGRAELEQEKQRMALPELREDVARQRDRIDAAAEALQEITEKYVKDKTRLRIVDKLFDIEKMLATESQEPFPPSPTPPSALGYYQRALAARKSAKYSRDSGIDALVNLETALNKVEAKLEQADAALEKNQGKMKNFMNQLELRLPALFEQHLPTLLKMGARGNAPVQPPTRLQQFKSQFQQLRIAFTILYPQWQRIEAERKGLILRVREETMAELHKAGQSIEQIDDLLSDAERHFTFVVAQIENLWEHQELPFQRLPAESPLHKRPCAIYLGPLPKNAKAKKAAGTPRELWVRYYQRAGGDTPAEGEPQPGAEAYLVSRDNGRTWQSAAQGPPLPAFAGRTFLLGTDGQGNDIFDRLILGSRFYFNPTVLGLGLLIAFTFSLVLAFLSAVCQTRVWWQYLFLRRFTSALISSIAAMPAIVVIICVYAGLASLGTKAGYEWVIVFAIIFTQIPNLYNYLHQAILEYKTSEMLAHDLSIGSSWLTIIVNKILRERCLKIFLIQAFYILGYVILFETTLSYLGFAPPGEIESWGKLLVDEGRLPMTHYLLKGVPGPNDWVFLAPVILILLTIYVTNRIGKQLTETLLAKGRTHEAE